MELSTLTQIKTKLKNDCDIFDDDFIDLTTELLGLINAAIDDAESIIHNLYEDYFLVTSTISLVNGTQTYALPSDIFANKIRNLFYDDGSNLQYVVWRIRRFEDTMFIDSGDRYRYVLTNDSTNGVRLRLYPTPTETNTNMKIWYIRNAKKLSAETDSCDIPEFINFIYAHVKWGIARKDKSQFDLATAEKELAVQRQLMVDTLTDMVPDDGNEILMDSSFYRDFDLQNTNLTG